MAEKYYIVYMYYIFIHLPVHGHLGCCHVLAVVSSVIIGCMYFFEF